MAAGTVLGTAAVLCLVLHAISFQQAIAMVLPAALLIIGAAIWGTPPDPAASGRLGFLAGFQLGSLLTWLRSIFRQRGNGV
jgi:hypothetical protein